MLLYQILAYRNNNFKKSAPITNDKFANNSSVNIKLSKTVKNSRIKGNSWKTSWTINESWIIINEKCP